MPGYGRNVIGVVGNSVQLIATDFEDAIFKVGGCTIDWTVIDAVQDDTPLAGGTTVLAGQKYIPIGTVMMPLTSGDNAGKYAPYNEGGSHGEQDKPTRDSVLMTEDWLENAPFALTTNYATDYFGGLQAGTVWFGRLKVGDTGQPSVADFEAAFPGILYAHM